MESCILSPPQAERSTKNISCVLSKNVLGVVLGFCDLNTLPEITKLNRKIKSVISDEKIIPMFSEYLKERKYTRRIKKFCEVFFDDDSRTSYITALRNRLEIKYNIHRFVISLPK